MLYASWSTQFLNHGYCVWVLNRWGAIITDLRSKSCDAMDGDFTSMGMYEFGTLLEKISVPFRVLMAPTSVLQEPTASAADSDEASPDEMETDAKALLRVCIQDSSRVPLV